MAARTESNIGDRAESWGNDDARREAGANAEKVLAALADFGAPLQDLTVSDLARPGLIFQIGGEPIRIDVITAIDGVEFPEAWAERMTARFADQNVAICLEGCLSPTSGPPVVSRTCWT